MRDIPLENYDSGSVVDGHDKVSKPETLLLSSLIQARAQLETWMPARTAMNKDKDPQPDKTNVEFTLGNVALCLADAHSQINFGKDNMDKELSTEDRLSQVKEYGTILAEATKLASEHGLDFKEILDKKIAKRQS